MRLHFLYLLPSTPPMVATPTFVCHGCPWGPKWSHRGSVAIAAGCQLGQLRLLEWQWGIQEPGRVPRPCPPHTQRREAPHLTVAPGSMMCPMGTPCREGESCGGRGPGEGDASKAEKILLQLFLFGGVRWVVAWNKEIPKVRPGLRAFQGAGNWEARFSLWGPHSYTSK